MEPKIGVYICKGCEIGSALDIEKLSGVALKDGKADLCKTHDMFCSVAGLELIKSDITSEGINRVVVAACSNRAFPELFDFGKDILTDRVNLREQVAWCHKPNDDDTQMIAEDYVRMGVARVRNSEPPQPYIEETSKTIMVVGGGKAGLTAAKAAAAAGYKVILIEKENHLGGWGAKFSKVFPKTAPYQLPENSGINELINEVESDPHITIKKGTTISKTSSQPGKFSVVINDGSVETELQVGAIVQATGWKPYDPAKLSRWGYGVTPDVITNIDLEAMVTNGGIKRPSDGKTIESIAFIQCAGSREPDHLPYCSAVCCRVSLKQALYVREKYPHARIFIIYRDLRATAQYELFYAHVQNDDAIFLTKGEIAAVSKADGGKIAIDVKETLLGEDIRITADMVVLATGMVPSTKVDESETEAAPLETSESTETAAAPQDGLMADGKKEAAGAEKGAKILNLTYRQGTDLPTLRYGFPDSHYICFPYETRRTGIYAAGTVRAPMDLSASESDAYGAALKAIQAVESIARGAAVHPRSGDLSFPEFFMQRCTQCKRCTEECPFGTLDEDAKGTPLPNPFRCRRCGICMGACPERIISFKNYNVNMISQMIKAIHIPDEFEEKPRILAFICENDALPSLDMAGMKRLQYNAMVRLIPLRCLGSMNTIWVGDALASGFDGVLLIGCKKGDDYQCHFIRGSELAATRMSNVREKLKQLVLEEERVQLHEVAISDYARIPKIFDEFLETIERVGPNPYKGM
ncbi:MAG: hydrogenase iron-sulfur subunit [bacterium]|jgi:quinone-modifying oxidoreductase subunit QmoB